MESESEPERVASEEVTNEAVLMSGVGKGFWFIIEGFICVEAGEIFCFSGVGRSVFTQESSERIKLFPMLHSVYEKESMISLAGLMRKTASLVLLRTLFTERSR